MPNRLNNSPVVATLLWMILAGATATASIPPRAAVILERYCYSCHDEDTQKGEIRLDILESQPLDAHLDLLNRMQEQLFLGEMPPEAKKKQPTEGEREVLANWISGELKKRNASQLEDKLRYPSYGNYVDHDKLFSGELKDKAYSPARRWLVSPQIFIERVADVFKLEARGRSPKFYGVTNPIILPERSGIRYYDNTALDGGHLLVMLTNAEWISTKQIRAARVKNGEIGADEFPNSKDKWYPNQTPQAFETIILKTSKPTDDEIVAAIQTQFDCVLQREANSTELEEYFELTRSAIDLGGNTEGLRQMLISVLLESEFLYRLEFGAGEVDAHGRKKLSPREASYAIAYAISDQSPDAQLVAAAREGRLETKADFRREVLRMLDDKQSFYAEGAPTVNSLHLRSHKVTHPKINRFFREFFGYANSMKVFKDTARSGGFFANPDRGFTGTAGAVTDEADKVVDYVLRQDKDVFAQLLTTDSYFVLHRYDNERGAEIVDSWKQAYESLKNSGWEKDPSAFILDNFEKYREAFKRIKITKLDGRNNVRELKRYMEYFDHTFGRGITPFTYPWFFHGGQKFGYSEIYSLPKIPGAGPIGGNGVYRDKENWDYPLVQPFRVQNRKGILTHPAWLVAHSQNTETDPVKRGRWIREKLLAGRVPNVPITVDAQIPEDHHKTLRERLQMVTGAEQCWKCHRQMNPLGLPFEIFDDFGRHRLAEELEHPDNLISKGNGKSSANTYRTKPVDAIGALTGTGDPALDGEVADAFDLIDRLAKSERVRQSIIRHAFRYFMGRNEMLSDSQTLIDAEAAYVENDGSFKAVVVSLLTSDSFIYRKRTATTNGHQ
ncbi:MAG: hypothetical protein ACI9UA_005345 [Pseudoalteromonas tetraodonis]|jgi:hypothetical protein